ncbi:MAG: hypothetical protein Q9166_002896 [cf. Caloplaca sp. 2 TL-2023]
MVGPDLPGRPGSLTADQEAKLQELWTATLRVFGVQALDRPEDAESHQSGSGTATPDMKPKKKKHGIFRRQKDDDNDEASTDQEDKYGQSKAFQQVLATQNPENLRKAFWSMVKHDHPDGLLLRFLRARKWDVHNALVMMVATMNWRMQEMHVDDDIMKKGEAQAMHDTSSSNAAVRKEGQDFLAQLKLGKSFLHGTDKEGRPMCFVRDYGPVKFMIKCFEANYPESLGVVLVHKSPWIFHSVWNIIKGWLDPVVANKVHFTKNLEELEHFIEKSHIIKELGGDDPWEYNYVEFSTGENQQMSDEDTTKRLLDERANIVKDYESTTQEWISDPQNRTTLQQKRNDLAERLRSGYWQLDPYVRARSLYDRTGLIREGGVIQYYGKPETPNAPKPLIASPQNMAHGADDVD